MGKRTVLENQRHRGWWWGLPDSSCDFWLKDQPACGINTMTSLSFFLLISCQCLSLTKPIRKPVGKGAFIMHKCSPRAESGVVERVFTGTNERYRVWRKGENFSSIYRKKYLFSEFGLYKNISICKKIFNGIKQNSRESILKIYAEM